MLLTSMVRSYLMSKCLMNDEELMTRFGARSSPRRVNELDPGNSVGCRLLTWEQIAGRSEAEIWAMFDQYTDRHIASPRRGVRQFV